MSSIERARSALLLQKDPGSPAAGLRAAADLIEPDGAWTQGANAKNADGLSVGPLEDTAVCWCARGAVIKVTGARAEDARELPAMFAIRDEIPGFLGVSTWNDTLGRTQAEVVALMRSAADRAEVPA